MSSTRLRSAAELAARARAAMPGGVSSGQRSIPGLEDLVISRTDGARFWDADGREYVDFHAAFGPPLLGHNDPDVTLAVISALTRTDLAGVGVTPEEIELGERLIELVPSFQRCLLTSTGSEATFHALRLSRAVTGRRLVVKFQGCYHGWHDAVSLNVISAPEMIGRRDPISTGILSEVLDATLVLPFNDIAVLRRTFADHGPQIAAVIVEPVPHNVGALLPDQEFLQALREETTRAGTILVFDEVITGFRHHLGGWQAISGVTPDLTTLGKAIANGYPLGAIGGRADLMDEFSTIPGRPVFFAGTYNGHPGIAAAANATLTKLQTEPVHEHVFTLGGRIRDGLSALFAGKGVPAQVTGYGSVFVAYFMTGPRPRTYADLLANDVGRFIGYRRNLIADGLFELPLNLKRSHVSYRHTDQDVDRLLEAADRAIDATVLDGGATLTTGVSTMGSAHEEPAC
ncbi:aspartate aminotransferase family protein [Actinopolymorpha alba]|uniref:aspartate aminotransferase family protein n=1 Tax=Actinopolymorpha alba TaxID=533267 RepID=UPI0003737D40|nr:aspartate aminotransferase family protein [Actinopolymorpha alba]